MNKNTRIIRIAIAAVLALLLAGSAASTLAAAMGAQVSVFTLYLAALGAAALGGLCAWSGIAAIVAAVLFVVVGGAYAAANLEGLNAIPALFSAWQGGSVDAARLALGGNTLSVVISFVMGAIFFVLMYRREFVPLGLLLLFALLVGCYALSDMASLIRAVPGLIAAVAAFALAGGVQRDSAALRVLIPSALAVILALMLVPAGRVTWTPLENAANQVRGIFEQYFNFTRERVAFSINEEGYDHAGEVDDNVVAMLGGPAQPDTQPVMTVETSEDVLLRGAIRATYTGYSWVDTQPKNRYLYYDLTRSNVRDRVFNLNFENAPTAFDEVSVAVEMLDEGTSTLFVPGRLSGFSMDLSNAVYYNTSGEVFMARQVEPGDAYTLKALIPQRSEALREAVIQAERNSDDQYQDILSDYTVLPLGIDEGVYALTVEIIQNAASAYDRALAIESYLRQNYTYTLEVGYPPEGRDFVSYFVLESKEGYCSYFASAMAVMGRIAGLPTRYVEGYVARPDANGQATLTGEDAHAWVEVYFKGIGWLPFDASGGAGGGAQQGSEDQPEGSGNASAGSMDAPLTEPTPTPTPSPLPEGGALDNEPTPSPEPENSDFPEETEAPPEEEPETPEPWPDQSDLPDNDQPDAHPNLTWLWILLAVLLALALTALAVLWARSRMRQADPILLSGQAESASQAAMILYRAILTLLAHMGQGPVNGETPENFVERIAQQFDNPDYQTFVHAVSLNRYARQPIEKADIEAGRRAYLTFRNGMRRMERLRFDITRVLHGLGDFESIP